MNLGMILYLYVNCDYLDIKYSMFKGVEDILEEDLDEDVLWVGVLVKVL